MKVLVFYTVTLSLLFCALTVLFSALGIGTSEPPTATIATPASTVAPPSTVIYEDEPEQDIKYGYLLEKKSYQVELPTSLYQQRGEEASAVVALPARGIFVVEKRIEAIDTLWYRVRVSDGKTNHRFFLRAPDLNLQTVKRYLTRPLTAEERYSESIQEKLAKDQFALVKETFGSGTSRATRVALEEAERLRQEAEMQTMQTKLNTGFQSFNAQGILSSALLAGIVTIVMAAMLGAIAWLRFTKRWTSGRDIQSMWGEDGDDYVPEEEYEQRSLPNSNTNDPYA